jgi:4-hydroxybenzoate polyprenyltransferase
MIHLLRLIRFPNLVIIALTMVSVRYGLLETLWKQVIVDMLQEGFLVQGIRLNMGNMNFLLLLSSTLLIAAAGYIINDYFDTKIDRINKPEKVVVGRSIKRRVAMALHLSMSALACMIAVYLAHRTGNIRLAGIQAFSIVALWFYSTILKKQLLSGNILIALLAALVPLTVGIYEFASGALPDLEWLNFNVPNFGTQLLKRGAMLVAGFALFAFLTNLVRELVKDIEDIDGDLANGCRTLPIVVGEIQAKFIAMSIVVFTLIVLSFIQVFIWKFNLIFLFSYLLVAVQLPLLILLIQLYNANTKIHYTRASAICKLIIVTGVLSMWAFKFTY